MDVGFVGAGVDCGSADSDGTRRVSLQLGLNGLQAKHEQSLDVDVDVDVEEEKDVDGTIGDGNGDEEGGGNGYRCTQAVGRRTTTSRFHRQPGVVGGGRGGYWKGGWGADRLKGTDLSH